MNKIRFLIIISSILSAFVLLAVATETADVNEPNEQEAKIQTEVMEEAEVKAVDANSPEATLMKAWTDVERAIDSEAKQWLKLEMNQRVELARAAQRATEAQMKLLKMIAETEGATQITAAIDKILETETAKVDEVLDEAREARRQERLKEMEERRKAREELRKSRRDKMNQP